MRTWKHSLRQLAGTAMVGAVLLANVPMPIALAQDLPPQELTDPLPQATFPTPLFFLIVRWGNVIGEPETKDAVSMNGSVSLSSGRLELVKTLLFEPLEDSVTEVSETNISWTSTIHGHWDGVLLRGSAPANATATIRVGDTTITKAVSDLVRLKRDVTDLGSGRELVLQAFTIREPAVVLQAFWGRVANRSAILSPDRLKVRPLSVIMRTETPQNGDDDAEEHELETTEGTPPPPTLSVNFSGDLTISGGTITKAQPVAFEGNDVLHEPMGGTISWVSTIGGTELPASTIVCALLRDQNVAIPEGVPCPILRYDRDGIVVRARLAALNNATQFTIRFTDPALNFAKTFTLKDLWHRKFLFEPVKVNGADVGLGLVVQLHVLHDGKLVRAKGHSEVFVIEDGIRRHIVSPEALVRNGHDWSDVEEVEAEDIDAVPEGDPVDLPEGTPVKGRGPAVFVFTDRGLCPVASPQAFEAIGLRWDEIVPLPDETINAKPKCKVIDGPEDLVDGLLVRPAGQPTVFLVDNGALLHIPSPAVFVARGFRWEKVKDLPPAILAQFPQSGTLEMPDGVLVKGNGPRVFVIEQGKKRPFLDAEDFVRAGFRWEKIRHVDDSALIAIPSGPAAL